MTDLTKATRFLADQTEKNGKRKKEKETHLFSHYLSK